MAEVFRHDREASTYDVTIDGTPAGLAGYELTDGVADFDHTEVSPDFGGRGVAGRLVQYAMDDVRAAGEMEAQRQLPLCRALVRAARRVADLLA